MSETTGSPAAGYPQPGRARFSTTHWSVVVAAAGGSSPEAREALEALCRTYWSPVYAFLQRRGHGPAEAEDLTQAFFLRLLERDVLKAADPARGRFRTFLLTAVKNFAINQHARQVADKRGGGIVHEPLDVSTAEPRVTGMASGGETPERTFERQWAMALLERALDECRRAYDRTGRLERFQALQPVLSGGAAMPPYAELATQLRMSEGAVKVAVHRLRDRYRRALRAEVARTVAETTDIDAELRHLIAVVSAP